MSRKVEEWAWPIQLPAYEKLLLVTLATYADTRGNCYPTLEQLRVKSGLTLATLLRTFKVLEKGGLITKKKMVKKGAVGNRNCYQLQIGRTCHTANFAHSKLCREQSLNLSQSKVHSIYIRSIENTSYYSILLVILLLSSNKNLNPVIVFSFFDHFVADRKIPEADVFFDENFKRESQAKKTPKIPPCPYQQIVELYQKWLPMCPAVFTLTETRKRYIQARWRQNPNLVNFDKFFKWVSKSKFLTGQVSARGDRRPFVATLDWLMRPENYVKVLEHKYHE